MDCFRVTCPPFIRPKPRLPTYEEQISTVAHYAIGELVYSDSKSLCGNESAEYTLWRSVSLWIRAPLIAVGFANI